jgi:RNA polymerase sigma-70 factor (ECF subfamily)
MAEVRNEAVPGADHRAALSRALVEEGDRLYALAFRVTRDPELAKDAVQEAFLSALDHVDAFRGDARLSTWLHRIVYNKSIDILRRRRREEPLLDEEAAELTAADVQLGHGPAWARPPDELLRGVETQAALDQALGQLTPLQRAVFELKEAEGRPTAEVAEILGMAEPTVRVHLHRARLKLRDLLAGHFQRARA